RALLDLLDELGTHELCPPSDNAVLFRPQVQTFHQVIGTLRDRVLEVAVELRWSDQVFKVVTIHGARMNHRHRLDSRSFEQRHPTFKIEKDIPALVVDIELKEIVLQLPVVDRVSGVDPFAEQEESVFQTRLQHMPLRRSPLLEQVVLRVHPLGDEMTPALQNHITGLREVDTDVRAVDLLFNDQRLVGKESQGLRHAEVLVVVRPLRPEQMRRAGVLGEFTVRSTHRQTPCVRDRCERSYRAENSTNKAPRMLRASGVRTFSRLATWLQAGCSSE